MICICFFFNDTATTEIYTLSLHDALPILAAANSKRCGIGQVCVDNQEHDRLASFAVDRERKTWVAKDRKSTRLNSSHANISYAVFCLKKKKHAAATRRLLAARTISYRTNP